MPLGGAGTSSRQPWEIALPLRPRPDSVLSTISMTQLSSWGLCPEPQHLRVGWVRGQGHIYSKCPASLTVVITAGTGHR